MNRDGWISLNWNALTRGAKVQVPDFFGPLPQAGFRPTNSAAPEGQAADWVLPMSDGSRIHVHVYGDGRRVAHRDRFDPDRGLGPMLAHLTFDTPYVAIGLGVSLLFAGSSTGG